MDEKLLEKLKTLLQTQEHSLKNELEGFAKKDDSIAGNWNAKYPNKERGDKEEDADEAQEYDNLLSLEQSLEVKLKDVNSALEKIKHGTYGKCERCGKEIEGERLLAYPEARLCVSCNNQT